MPIEFVPAVRERTRLIILLAGATGSGKTRSALEIARGLCRGDDSKIKAIDTENGRMLFFAPPRGQRPGKGTFGFRHGNMRPPFSPNDYKAAIEEGSHDCECLIVDSFSHEWDGEGGMHDMQAEALDKMMKRNPNLKEDTVSSLAWKEPKMDHRKLVSKMLQISPYLILCLRAEEKLRIERQPIDANNPTGPKKTVFIQPSDLPMKDRWVMICEKRLPFESTMSLLFVPDRPGVPIPVKLNEEHKFAVPLDRQVTDQIGRDLADWADGGVAKAADPGLVAELLPANWNDWGLEERGANRATRGTAVLEGWWKSLTAAERVQLKNHLEEWKAIAAKVSP
jgi:hypothetical protein